MQVKPAKLESFEVDLEDKIKEFSPKNLSKRERLKNLEKYSEEDERELLEAIVDAVDGAVDQVLPFPLSLLITEKMIHKLALFLFRYVSEKVIEIIPD